MGYPAVADAVLLHAGDMQQAANLGDRTLGILTAAVLNRYGREVRAAHAIRQRLEPPVQAREASFRRWSCGFDTAGAS